MLALEVDHEMMLLLAERCGNSGHVEHDIRSVAPALRTLAIGEAPAPRRVRFVAGMAARWSRRIVGGEL